MAVGAVFPVTILAQYRGQIARDMLGVERSVSRAGQAANQATGSFKNLAGAFTGLLVAGKIRDAFAAIMKPTADLEMAFARLKGLTGAGAEELEKFRVKAMQVAGITPYGPVEVTNALLKLRQATGDANGALDALKATTQLAMASFGEMNVEQTSKMMGDMMRTFSLTGKEADAAANMMFGAAKATGLAVSEYRDIMGKLGVAAMRGGQSFSEMIKAFTLVRRAGISSQQSVTGLIRIMGELQTTKGIEAFKKVGVDPIDATTQSLKPLSQILLELTDRFRQFPAATKEAFGSAFRERSMKTALAMVTGLANGVRSNTGELLHAEKALNMVNGAMMQQGQLQQQSDIYLGTLSGNWETLKEEFTKVAINIGNMLAPMLMGLMKIVKGFGHALNWLTSTPIVSWFTGVAAAGIVLRGGVIALGAAWQGVTKIFKLVVHNLREAIATQGVEEKTTRSATRAKNAYAAASTRAALALEKENAARGINLVGSSALPAPGEYAAQRAQAKQLSSMKGMMGLRMDSTSLVGGAKQTMRVRALAGLSKGIKAVSSAAKAAGPALMAFFGGPIGLIAALATATIAYRKEIGGVIEDLGRWVTSKSFKAIDDLAEKAGMAKGRAKGFGQGTTMALWQKMQESTLLKPIAAVFGYHAKFAEDAMKNMAKTVDRDIYRKLVEGGRKVREELQLGGKVLSDELDRIDKMINWKPPVVQWSHFERMQNQLKRVSTMRGMPESERMAAKTAMAGMDKIRKLQVDAEKTGKPITPADYRFIANAGRMVHSFSKHLRAGYGGAAMSATLSKQFGKGWLKEMIRAGSKENMRFTEDVTVLKAGTLTGGAKVRGWKPEAGGFREGAGGPAEQFFGSVIGQMFPEAGRAAQQRAQQAEREQLRETLGNLGRTLSEVFGGKPLKVIIAGDETGGGGKGAGGGGKGLIEGILGEYMEF